MFLNTFFWLKTFPHSCFICVQDKSYFLHDYGEAQSKGCVLYIIVLVYVCII